MDSSSLTSLYTGFFSKRSIIFQMEIRNLAGKINYVGFLVLFRWMSQQMINGPFCPFINFKTIFHAFSSTLFYTILCYLYVVSQIWCQFFIPAVLSGVTPATCLVNNLSVQHREMQVCLYDSNAPCLKQFQIPD